MTKPQFRCAIYTRKSSEEGLDQEFNSLHAQREACEAYVKSQAGEGWILLDEPYDDGGVSGGTMERDGLKRLLADIAAGKVDVVVVYKVDRLTRSLHDFAKIVDVFDRQRVSFVSVTQAFNTTTSMGRLTLNVLLSFAQFEREVTGERIRDKIAASKAKGLWMGGAVPLGYRPNGRSLEVVPEEAEIVRTIFARYLELRSVHRLVDELREQGVRSKVWVSASGGRAGGQPFNRGSVLYLLKNPIYVGGIRHRDVVHPGTHAPIIEQTLFDSVQRLLNDQRRERSANKTQRAPLRGLIFDADGRVMSPTTARGRNGQIYRYYVSAYLQQGGRAKGGDFIERLPALPLEGWVARTLSRLLGAPFDDAATYLERLEVHRRSVCLSLKAAAASPTSLFSVVRPNLEGAEAVAATATGCRVDIPGRLQFRGGRAWINVTDGSTTAARPERALVEGLKTSHRVLAAHSDENGHLARRPKSSHEKRLLRLAFLAPDIQASICEGRQPVGLQLEHLRSITLPYAWPDQKAALRRAGAS